MGIVLMLFSLSLGGTIVEDAEDKKSSRWHKIDDETVSSVVNILDKAKKSRVIQFKGERTRTAYLLKNRITSKKRGTIEYLLSWEMKFSEDFVIIVTVETTRGEKVLLYTPGIFQSYMLFGLGMDSANGEWQKQERNLQADLDYYDNRCKILALKSFVIRGSGEIDNLATSVLKVSKSVVSKKNVSQKNVLKNRALKTLLQHRKIILPTIEMKGDNPLHLEVGEAFVEPGVRAHDEQDGEVEVVSMKNIDSSEEGKYTVIYMVKNRQGNSAISIRHIIVGNPPTAEEEATLEEGVLLPKENQDFVLEERELQAEEWERELELREQALKDEFNREKELLKKHD